jgi:hypothetical protein
MNISEEKQFIYDMMRDVSKERRQLTDIYFGLKKRLDDLNTLEMRGLEDLSIKGYVDLYNDHNRRSATENIMRESQHMVNRINREADELEKQSQPKPTIPQHEISEQRFRDNQEVKKQPRKATATTTGKKKNRNAKEIIATITNVFKEEGIPLNSRKVFDILNKQSPEVIEGIPIDRFRSNYFYRATTQNDDIERVSEGFYQLRK